MRAFARRVLADTSRLGTALSVALTAFTVWSIIELQARGALDEATLAARGSDTPWIQAMRNVLLAVPPLLISLGAVLMGIGGIGYERSSGTALFTLSLPLTRRQLLLSRYAVGLGWIVLLAIITPTVTAVQLALLGHRSGLGTVPMVVVTMCGTAGALLLYSFAFLTANVTADAIRSVATVTLISFLVLVGINGQHGPGSHPTPFDYIDFGSLLAATSYLRAGDVPWGAISLCTCVSVAMLWLTVHWIERQDFG